MSIDWTTIYKKYKGMWVAVEDWDNPQVVAHGKTLKETMHQAEKKGVRQPFVTQVPQKVIPIVG